MFIIFTRARAWIITRLRHFEFLSISAADHLRLLPQAGRQGNSIFRLKKGILRKIMHKSNRCFKLELECPVLNCLKKARKLFKKEKKSCKRSEKLLEGLKVAPNLKSCSKVDEQLMDSPS